MAQQRRKNRVPGLAIHIPKNQNGDRIRGFNSASLFSDASKEEITALHLLRGMIEQEQFRRYLKDGFLVIRGESGLDYQICHNDYIQVRERGEAIASLCLHLRLERRPAPPTDHVVAKMLIVQCEESEIWRRSNITWKTQNRDRDCLEKIGLRRTKEESHIETATPAIFKNLVGGTQMTAGLFQHVKEILEKEVQRKQVLAAVG